MVPEADGKSLNILLPKVYSWLTHAVGRDEWIDKVFEPDPAIMSLSITGLPGGQGKIQHKHAQALPIALGNHR